MARRKANPFADKLKRLPHRATIKRSDPYRRNDDAEIDAVCRRIAAGADYISYAGRGGALNGCRVFGFDTAEKARAMQTWIDTSGIASRPIPQLSLDDGGVGWAATKEDR